MNKEVFHKLTDKFKNPVIQALCLIAEIVVLIVAFVLLQNGTGVDYDEAFTWDVVANNGLGGIIAATAADVHPPLYYLICKFAFCVFGRSLKVLLWFSVFPVILGMILSSVFIWKNWGFSVAFLFNLIYGFAPFILHYNLNLRMYSWMAFFVLGVVLVTYELMNNGSGKLFILLYLFSIMSVYTQYFAVLPIVICYAWLFFSFIVSGKRKQLIYFLTVGAMDVISYLPWLKYGMKNMGIGAGRVSGDYGFYLEPSVIFKTLFETNLENGDIMAIIISVMAVVLFVLFHKRYKREEKSFLIMLLCNTVFCWYFSQWLGSLNGHFFAPRYVIYCLVFLWLFILIVLTRCNLFATLFVSLWTVELCLSSFLVERAYEYETTPLMPQTMEFIRTNITSDDIIVYDYAPEFRIIYQYYMPENEFVFFEDLDPSEMKGSYFWVINLAGAYFSPEETEEYGLRIEEYPGMGFMGMERFDFWKVTVNE